ncbi:sugar-binding domain-containing protein [Mangrovibacterium sp.]|uniref:sugar-binding domain-containing protein n=1 Tax=Mangrovibacterium sp. TaxID=1961364 RepID=UPI003562B179
MKRLTIILVFAANLLVGHALYAQRMSIDFNAGWRFSLQDLPTASKVDFDDTGWKNLSIPHDWAHEGGVSKDGAQSEQGGYFDGGIGWYRKSFDVPAEWLSKLVTIEFDGVYMNSEVWINGHYLGKRPYGYISFRYDLSDYLISGNNCIAVRVDNSKEPSARWYHPCGIYAPVRLVATGNHRIAPNGIAITSPIATSQKANLKIATELLSSSSKKKKLSLETTITNPSGKTLDVSRATLNWENDTVCQSVQELSLENPNLWSPETPYLYIITSRLWEGRNLLDVVETKYGIRQIEWKTDSGFWLNGEQTKLLGVCEHYEGGPVGGAWTKPLLRWKLALLKEMGVNAIRTAHNPAPPMFYELCDEMGFLVMDEIFDGWKRKAKMDYGAQAFDEWWEADLTEWIKRNRNYSSIIIYSVGNETDGEIAESLVAKCHQLDPTRLVTSGHSASEFMDVFGVNGGSEKQGFYSKERPDKPFVATEAPHTWQTRGYYRTKTWFRDGYPNKGQQPFELPDLTETEVFQYEWAAQDKWVNGKQHFNSSYDNATVRISARKNWELMRDLPWYSGHFRWTGFDYFGEAGYVHGGWPFRLFMGGALDVAGFEKDLFYFYQSQWTEKPMVHILPHWTHPTLKEGTEIPVWVYSNCDEVELFLNGESMGKDKPGTKWDEMQCEWMVPWEAGTIEAIGFKNGNEVVRMVHRTAGSPAGIQLTNDSVHFNILKDNTAIVTTAVTDAAGVVYPYGENTIYYHIDGNAKLISLENGDPVDTTPNVGVNYRKAFMGLTRTFLKLGEKAQNVGITAGAILGEKQFITSNKVFIDVKKLTLVGDPNTELVQIFYTVDGTDATTKSKLYSGPFTVELGTTVKAIVVQNGEIILTMTERFDKDLGLCWEEEKSARTANDRAAGMRAVDADFTGASVEGTNDEKYLDFKSGEGKIIWYQENDGSAGLFTLKLSYANMDPQSMRPMDLIINTKKVATLSFKPTGSWSSDWQQVTTVQSLKAGANYIELHTTGESAPNILMIQVD